MLVRNDLAIELAKNVNRAALAGTGVAPHPLGSRPLAPVPASLALSYDGLVHLIESLAMHKAAGPPSVREMGAGATPGRVWTLFLTESGVPPVCRVTDRARKSGFVHPNCVRGQPKGLAVFG
jgi:hypothetical protein